MSAKIMKSAAAIGLFAAGYLMGSIPVQESKAGPIPRVDFIHYSDHYIELDLYTPVDVQAEMRQRHMFRQQGANRYRLNLWYNQ